MLKGDLITSKNFINVNIGNAHYSIQSGAECYFEEYKQGGITLVGWGNHVFNLKDFEPVKRDLTKIDEPFAKLDNNTKLDLMKALYIDNETVEVLSFIKTWVEVGTRDPLNPQKIYRLKPEKSPNQIKKENLELRLKKIQEELSQLEVKD